MWIFFFGNFYPGKLSWKDPQLKRLCNGKTPCGRVGILLSLPDWNLFFFQLSICPAVQFFFVLYVCAILRWKMHLELCLNCARFRTEKKTFLFLFFICLFIYFFEFCLSCRVFKKRRFAWRGVECCSSCAFWFVLCWVMPRQNACPNATMMNNSASRQNM